MAPTCSFSKFSSFPGQMNIIPHFVIFLHFIHYQNCQSKLQYCRPLSSKFDILFLVDSTLAVANEENHSKMLEFIAAFVEAIELGGGDDEGSSRFAVAQFTPELRIEFNFNDGPAQISRLKGIGEDAELGGKLKERILSIPYSPCPLLCLSKISLNYAIRRIFYTNQDHSSTSALVFLLTTSSSRPPESQPSEVLLQPRAPIHFFIITIGRNSDPNLFKPVEFAATTIHLGAIEFDHLQELVDPLCQSLHSFIGDEENEEAPLPASFCFICLVISAICLAFLFGLLFWAIQKYRKEVSRHENLMKSEKEKLKQLEEYYKRKLRNEERERAPLALERTLSELPMDHPALKLPPVDVLLLVDGSGSIGNKTFEQVKIFLRQLAGNIDVAPGRSRIACVVFGNEPFVYFDFNRFHSISSVQYALLKIPLLGGGTRLAKALAFASGMLAREQTMMDFGDDFKMQTLSSPKLCENLQLLILTSDGVSDDNFDEQAAILNETAAVVTKKFYREKLIPIVRYGDAIFTLAQIEALANWIWHQQKIRNEKFNGTGKGERTFQVSDLDLNNSKVNKTKKMNTTQNYS